MNLDFFKREKSFLRKIAHEFSLKFPKIAGHLNYGAFDSGDPHIERLIESFAFLTGNIQEVLEGEFPEVTTAMLGILYPNLIQPIPPMTIVRFDLVPGTIPLGSEAVIKRGSPMFAQTSSGIVCSFRTAYDTEITPIDIVSAQLESVDNYSFLEKMPNVGSVIRLRIRATGEAELPEINLRKLRLFLSGDPMIVSQLYETLFCNLIKAAIIPQEEPEPVYLPETSILQAGFGENEEVIPTGKNSHPAYRLIQEYFCFPEKFYFIDVMNLHLHRSVKEFDLLFILNNNPHLDVSDRTFVPNCTPVINLFEKNAATLEINHKTFDYPLIADPGEGGSSEIHSILEVTRSAAGEKGERKIEPFYAFAHEANKSRPGSFWHLRRTESRHRDVGGTDVMISFRDLNFRHTPPKTERVFVKALCTNRNMAEKIPAGALFEMEEKGIVQQAVCLKKPTPNISPPLRGSTLWRLISNLTLNYLSFSDGDDSLKALQVMLRTYNFMNNNIAEQQIMGIRSMSCEKTLHKTGFEGWRGFCKGLKLSLTIDPSYYAGSSAFLFVSVLTGFFSMYVSVNSFVETVLYQTHMEGVWKRWPPVTGRKPIL